MNKNNKNLIKVIIFAILLFPIIGGTLSYLTSTFATVDLKEVVTYCEGEYKGIKICYTKDTFQSGFYYNRTIYINQFSVLDKEVILKHEYCHYEQLEIRNIISPGILEEMECYIKQWM